MNSPSVETAAKILDLERRVVLLERAQYGHAAPECAVTTLTRCYREAHRAMRQISRESADVWVAQAYLWDARALLAVGRLVADPYPFRPLLAVLDRCVLEGIPGAGEARTHLESVSQDLLVAQGLELVQPRDTMARLALEQAVSALGSMMK